MKIALRCLKSLPLLILAALPGCGTQSGSGDAGISGVGSFTYTIANGEARLSVVLKTVSLDAGARVPIQRPVGAYIEMSPDFESAGTLVALSVPLSSLVKNNSDLPVVGLPDGRPLPGVTNGALAATAFQLPVIGLTYFYLGNGDAYGIFFPVSLPQVPVQVSSNIRDGKGNIVGQIWGIPKSTSSKTSSSGVLFLFPVDGGD